MKIYKLYCTGYFCNSNCTVIAKDMNDAKKISLAEFDPEDWTSNINNIDAVELGTANKDKKRGIY